MLGARSGLYLTNTWDVRSSTVRGLVTVRARWTRLQTAATARLGASFLGTSDRAFGTRTGVATIGRLEGIAIFVGFAVVLARGGA